MSHTPFAYAVGDLVQLTWYGPVDTVCWRGWALVRNASGIRQRQALYWLGPPHWDCVWEDELYSIGQAPRDAAKHGGST